MTYTDAEVETAQTLWEVILELRPTHPQIDAWVDSVGSFEMRAWCRNRAHQVETLWIMMGEDYQSLVTWDWEFIRDVLTLTDWGPSQPAPTMPGNDQLRVMLLAHFNAKKEAPRVPHP